MIQISHTCVEYLLATRGMFSSVDSKLEEGSNTSAAYALFNKSRYVAILLSLLIAAEFVNMCISVSDMALGVSFEIVCVIVPVPKKTTTSGYVYPLIYYILRPNQPRIIVPITQTTLVGLIIFRSILARHSGWGRTPLVSLLIREGLATYFLMISKQFPGCTQCTH
jgi:hypothetical protein